MARIRPSKLRSGRRDRREGTLMRHDGHSFFPTRSALSMQCEQNRCKHWRGAAGGPWEVALGVSRRRPAVPAVPAMDPSHLHDRERVLQDAQADRALELVVQRAHRDRQLLLRVPRQDRGPVGLEKGQACAWPEEGAQASAPPCGRERTKRADARNNDITARTARCFRIGHTAPSMASRIETLLFLSLLLFCFLFSGLSVSVSVSASPHLPRALRPSSGCWCPPWWSRRGFLSAKPNAPWPSSKDAQARARHAGRFFPDKATTFASPTPAASAADPAGAPRPCP